MFQFWHLVIQNSTQDFVTAPTALRVACVALQSILLLVDNFSFSYSWLLLSGYQIWANVSSVWISQAIFLVICPMYLSDTNERVVGALPFLHYPALQIAAVRRVNCNCPGCSWSLLCRNIFQDQVSHNTSGGWQWPYFYSNILASGTFMADPQKQSKPKHIVNMSFFSNTAEYKHHQ